MSDKVYYVNLIRYQLLGRFNASRRWLLGTRVWAAPDCRDSVQASDTGLVR